MASMASTASGGFTYPQVGATRQDVLPAGYSHLRVSTRIGTGREVFRAAGAAVLDWRMHRAIPVTITTDAVRAEPGTELVVGLGAGRLRLPAPCRVVWTVESERRAGFAYGTLGGHPECGEEAFIVEWAADDSVSLTVTAFSRPQSRLARLAGPLVPVLQRTYARRCGKVLRQLTNNGH